MEVCDWIVDFGGCRGDASVDIGGGLRAGPLSGVTGSFLAHALLTEVCRDLEAAGVPCTYRSVNTPEGQASNKAIERKASERDPLLRE